MDNKSGNDDLGKSRPWRFLRNVMRFGHGWQRTVSPRIALCTRGTIQTIDHRKSVCRPRVERVQRLDPFFATFTMISAYFSISQIEKPYEIRVFFLGISPTFHQPVTFVALGSTGAPVTLPSSHLLNGHLYQLLPVAVGMVWKSQAIRPQLHVDF